MNNRMMITNIIDGVTVECEITTDGRVWSTYSQKWLSLDYKLCVTVCKLGRKWKFSVPRQVALMWVPNPKNKPYVVFKDSNSNNLNVYNLEWSLFHHYHIGEIIGKLTVVDEEINDRGRAVLVVRCECGTVRHVYKTHWVSRGQSSCGCDTSKLRSNARRTHGYSRTPIYNILAGIHSRCHNSSNRCYDYYGGRGITICDEWSLDKEGIENFIAWMESNGWYEGCGLTVDRIDNGGNYEPSNCRLATCLEQGNNKSNNIQVSYRGNSYSPTDLAQHTGVKRSTIYERIKRGWSEYN